MARAFRRHHENVQIGPRLDKLEMHGKSVGECQRRTLFQVVAQLGQVKIGLQFVGRKDHRYVRPGSCRRRGHHLEAGVFRLGHAGRSFAQPDHNFLYAGIVQIVRMCVTLTAIANNRDFLVLDKINVRIPVVINSHRSTFP